MALSKLSFLARRPQKELELANGERVFLRPLPASVFVGLADAQEAPPDIALLLAKSLCDEAGNALVDESEAAELLNLPLADFNLLTREMFVLNGLAMDGAHKAEAEKN